MASALDLRRVRRPRSVGRDRLLGLGLLLALLGWAGAALAQPTQSPEAPSVPEGEGSEPVACLLPAAIDRLGRELTVVGPRQKIDTSRADCLARGGEVIPRQDAAPGPKESMR